MLILSRFKDEAIVIPEYGIEILVVDIRGDKVRLGINAPDRIDIYREEIWEDICAGHIPQRKKEDE